MKWCSLMINTHLSWPHYVLCMLSPTRLKLNRGTGSGSVFDVETCSWRHHWSWGAMHVVTHDHLPQWKIVLYCSQIIPFIPVMLSSLRHDTSEHAGYQWHFSVWLKRRCAIFKLPSKTMLIPHQKWRTNSLYLMHSMIVKNFAQCMLQLNSSACMGWGGGGDFITERTCYYMAFQVQRCGGCCRRVDREFSSTSLQMVFNALQMLFHLKRA